MPVDGSIFNNIKNFQDYNVANQDFLARQQAAALDAATKGSVLKGQLIGGAAATGDPAALASAKQQAQSLGIDVSDVPNDPQGAANYANALINAQKPYALTNAITKAVGADGPIINALGSVDAAKGAGLYVTPPSSGPIQVTQPTGASQPPAPKVVTPQDATTQPPSAFTKPTVAPQALPDIKPGNPETVGSGALLADMNGGTGNAPAAPQAAPVALPAPNATPPQPQQQPGESTGSFQARLSAWQQLPEVAAAKAGATTAAEEKAKADQKKIDSNLGNKDILRLYKKIGDEAPGTPGGIAQNVGANIANAANIPSDAANNRATMDADLNNLYLATIRSMAGTGRVQKAELEKIADAAPKQNDPTGVKISKVNAHLEDYNQRMIDMNFNPATGKPLQPGEQPQRIPPVPIPGKPGAGKVVNYTIQNGKLVAQ